MASENLKQFTLHWNEEVKWIRFAKYMGSVTILYRPYITSDKIFLVIFVKSLVTSFKVGHRKGQLCIFSLKTNLNEYGPYAADDAPDCGTDFTQIPVEGDFSEFISSNIIQDDTVGREGWIIGFKVPSE